MKIKIRGKDKFETKNEFIENAVSTLLKQFNPDGRNDVSHDIEFSKLRNQILKNEKILTSFVKKSTIEPNSKKDFNPM